MPPRVFDPRNFCFLSHTGVWGRSPHLGVVRGGAPNEVFFVHSFDDTKEWTQRFSTTVCTKPTITNRRPFTGVIDNWVLQRESQGIPKLKKAGAKGLVEYPLNKVIF
jgi:hypothetical protein